MTPGESSIGHFELSAAAARAVSLHDEFQIPRSGINFAFGLPDTRLFPAALIADAAAQVVAKRTDDSLQYTALHGSDRLLDQVRQRLLDAEGITLSPDRIAMTAGSSQAIALLGRCLADPGDTVLVEAPTFLGAARMFRVLGLKIVEVGVDDGGILLDEVEAHLEHLGREGIRPRFLYTMPTFHNPTGVTQDLDRRRGLLDVARRFELQIVEDDAYRELAYDGAPPLSLLALDADERTIRLGTYSKVLAPAMRLGWIAAPAQVTEALVALNLEQAASALTAGIAAELTDSGALDAHVTLLIDEYRAKRDRMLSALAEFCRPYAEWSRPSGGFFVWLRLNHNVSPGRLRERAREAGVAYLHGPACYASTGDDRCLRLAFSAVDPADIDEGVRRLGQAMAESVL